MSSHRELYYVRLYQESYFKLRKSILVYQTANPKISHIAKQNSLAALRQLNQARREMGYAELSFEDVVGFINNKVGYLIFQKNN